MQLRVFVQNALQFLLELFDLLHVLVLDAEVIHLVFNIALLRPHLVLFLDASNDCIKNASQILNLFVNLLYNFVLKRICKDSILDLQINFLNVLH